MFNKKSNDQDKELAAKIDQDLVVRNMPKPVNFSRKQSQLPPSFSGDQNLVAASSKKVKATGFIIILLGLIFIGVLIYLSYIFIIKPSTNDTNQSTIPMSSSTENDNLDILEKEDITVTVPVTSVTETTTPEIIDLNIPAEDTDLLEKESLDTELPLILDSDSDGLTDDEEIVLGTDINLVDSDADGYTDLVEINNGYDPLGNNLLNISKNINKYINTDIGYDLLYPKDWEIQSLNNNQTIIFAAPDGSLIQISVQINTNQQSILGWYENSFSSVTVTYDKLKNTDFWEGIIGEDGLNFYLTDLSRKNIYVISYIPIIEDHIAYPNIFRLIIDSLKID